MPDLGQYSTEVLSAYGVSIVILVVIVWQSFARARKVKAELERVEGNDG